MMNSNQDDDDIDDDFVKDEDMAALFLMRLSLVVGVLATIWSLYNIIIGK